MSGETADGTRGAGAQADARAGAGARTAAGVEADRIAAKLAARYPPPRVPRVLVVAAVAAVAAVFLSWLTWTAWIHANPVVSGSVNAFTIVSDTETDITLTVQRRDPSVPVSCRVIVQAPNFETVGQRDIVVPARTERLVDVKETIRTLRRGTSASLKECLPTG